MAVDRRRSSWGRLQAYVEVPVRPKSVAEREPRSDTTSDINMPSTSPPPRKRQLSDPDLDIPVELKKSKLTQATESTGGHLYCHQCNKKRDASQVISCTEAARKCRARYCKQCLTNRYGENIEVIKKTPPCGRGKAKMPYTFKCPKCQGICNCRTCRRAKGLEPTGNLTNAARKVGVSAAELLDANPDQKGILPGQGQERKRAKAAAAAKEKEKGANIAVATLKVAEKPRVKPKPKPAKPLIPVIQPTWTKLSNVPQEISFEDLEGRMFIREFMHRFSPLMAKEVKIHLDELGEIVGDGSVDWVDDEVQPKKGEASRDIPLVSWVSEKCIRSIVLGLLEIYADEASGPLKKGLQIALKEIKLSSANMTKIWATLASLRNAHPNEFTYPDPLPPPSAMPVYHTRRGAVHHDGIPVGHSAQLAPVVLNLIEGLMTNGSKTLKAEIDKNINETRDITKIGKEAIVRENERWVKEKTRLGTVKPPLPFRNAHKTRLDDLEKAQLTLTSCLGHRFCSLGRDDEGRRYFAFSPSVMEKEAASDIIHDDLEEVGTAPKKSAGGTRSRRGGAFTSGGVGAMDESKREELWNWDWFVAVWGRKPEGAIVAPDPHRDDDDGDTTDGDDEDDEGEDGHTGSDGWWAFWRPEDIRNLSRWIAYRNGLEHEDDDHGPKAGDKKAPHATHHMASNGHLIPPTGPSTASSTVDALSDRESTNPVHYEVDDDETDDDTNTNGIPREGSPLTDFDESSDESGNKKLMDSPPNSKPSERAVKELVSALSGYAQLLEWRVQRGERERKARQRD